MFFKLVFPLKFILRINSGFTAYCIPFPFPDFITNSKSINLPNQFLKPTSSFWFKIDDISTVIKLIQQYDINVGANYIFGFPHDNYETMQQTLDLALELNTEFANFYPCQALPGSSLYRTALEKGWELPDSYAGYAFLSYESKPLPTMFLSAAEVLKFRDQAWETYFSHEPYLNLIERKFGKQQRINVQDLSKVKLKRKLLELAN